jgi:hypothetical protein
MASSDKKKPSVNSQPNTAALVTVAGSELDFYTNSNYLAYELAKYAAAQRQGGLGSDDPEDDLPGDPDDEEEDGDDGEEGDGEDGESDGRPSLSDIEVISNSVVMSSAGLPSATVVFKVKNSSGVELKAINVRVEKK